MENIGTLSSRLRRPLGVLQPVAAGAQSQTTPCVYASVPRQHNDTASTSRNKLFSSTTSGVKVERDWFPESSRDTENEVVIVDGDIDDRGMWRPW